jgi:hypothetical protein
MILPDARLKSKIETRVFAGLCDDDPDCRPKTINQSLASKLGCRILRWSLPAGLLPDRLAEVVAFRSLRWRSLVSGVPIK